MIVECACDINNHILVETQEKPPKDYYSSFTDFSKFRVIPQNFASTLAETAGLRNRLVHEYEEIKDNIVYENIENVLRHYKKYIDYIIKYLEKT